MRLRPMTAALTLLPPLAAGSLMAAFHRTACAGEDIARTGQAIERAATPNTP